MYLIGSRALNSQLNLETNHSRDWDVVLENEECLCDDLSTNKQGQHQSRPIIECAPTDLPFLDVCREYDSGMIVDTPAGPARVVSLAGLMLIKRSHLHRPINFEKHIRDYHLLKEKCGPQDEKYYALLGVLTKATKLKWGDRTPSLRKSKKEFFDDYVTKYYDHDSLHYATCYYDRPIYERLKPDPDMVWCSRQLWDRLSYDDKVKCVREEGFSIGLERFIIPKLMENKPHPPPRFAFDWALVKICTTLTGGFFRDFAIEEWSTIRDHNYDFLQKFLDKKEELDATSRIS